MQALYLLDSVDTPKMGTRERLDGINDQLTVIEGRLSGIEKAAGIFRKPPGWARRKWQWVLTHKGTSISVTGLVLMFVGIFATPFIQHSIDHRYDYVDDRVAATLAVNGGVNDRLSELKTSVGSVKSSLETLRPFIQDAIHHEWDRASALPAAQLRNHLPALAHLATVAREERVSIDPIKLSDVAQKLLSMRQRPNDFWNASAKLITLRSFNSAPQELKQVNVNDLPICTDHRPTPMRIDKVLSPTKLHLDYGHYDDCRFDIDSPEENAKLNSHLQLTPLLEFRRCVITYSGGPINIEPVMMEIAEQINHVKSNPADDNAVVFKDCLFVLTITQQPSKSGQYVIDSLLAQNGSTLTFRAPTHLSR